MAFFFVLPGGADARAGVQNGGSRPWFTVWAACRPPERELRAEILLCGAQVLSLLQPECGQSLPPLDAESSLHSPVHTRVWGLWRLVMFRKHAFPPSSLYCPSCDYPLPREKGRAKEFSGTAHGEEVFTQ